MVRASEGPSSRRTMAQSITDKRFFDVNPLSGATEWFHYDPATDGFVIETVQDVEPLIEVNKALANDTPLRWGEWDLVAQIPSVIVMELAKQGIMSPAGVILDEVRMKRWLNDRDNLAFRARHGRV